MPRTRKPKRFIRLILSPLGDGVGVFRIRERDKTIFYTFREIPCEIGGRAFAIHRLGLGSLYHIRVGKRSECSCECLGFLAHGRCRHIEGLQTLIREGFV